MGNVFAVSPTDLLSSVGEARIGGSECGPHAIEFLLSVAWDRPCLANGCRIDLVQVIHMGQGTPRRYSSWPEWVTLKRNLFLP